MSNPMSKVEGVEGQPHLEGLEDQVQMALVTAGIAVDTTTGITNGSNGCSGTGDSESITEEQAEAWYRSHNVPNSSSPSTSAAATAGTTNTHSNSSPATAITNPGQHDQQQQQQQQQQSQDQAPAPVQVPDQGHHQQISRPPSASTDVQFHILQATWIHHLLNFEAAHHEYHWAIHVYHESWCRRNHNVFWYHPISERDRHERVAHLTSSERKWFRDAEWALWGWVHEYHPNMAAWVRESGRRICGGSAEEFERRWEESGMFRYQEEAMARMSSEKMGERVEREMKAEKERAKRQWMGERERERERYRRQQGKEMVQWIMRGRKKRERETEERNDRIEGWIREAQRRSGNASRLGLPSSSLGERGQRRRRGLIRLDTSRYVGRIITCT
ncbi:hypothetical protein QBC32DRAFT_379767 [Pseudoneurospora amorphoporcata]|uniref:Uncharacterized protein n=1 Tax=Pseudoneurospora amorphoporcata TaxID=241081 RepID=A0AAN6SCA3_9PEZI|nr:hypothetical protein QBC32DRAFT_379767 [Pseudoneurospora amorphoporcata]